MLRGILVNFHILEVFGSFYRFKRLFYMVLKVGPVKELVKGVVTGYPN
jgi:hypothetical protein